MTDYHPFAPSPAGPPEWPFEPAPPTSPGQASHFWDQHRPESASAVSGAPGASTANAGSLSSPFFSYTVYGASSHDNDLAEYLNDPSRDGGSTTLTHATTPSLHSPKRSSSESGLDHISSSNGAVGGSGLRSVGNYGSSEGDIHGFAPAPFSPSHPTSAAHADANGLSSAASRNGLYSSQSSPHLPDYGFGYPTPASNGRVRTSSDTGAFSRSGREFRSRSGSESSSGGDLAWSLSTPITPAEVHYGGRPFAPLKSPQGGDYMLSHTNHSPIGDVADSHSMQSAAYPDASLVNGPVQHARAGAGYPAPPILRSVRSNGAVARRASEGSLYNSDRDASPSGSGSSSGGLGLGIAVMNPSTGSPQRQPSLESLQSLGMRNGHTPTMLEEGRSYHQGPPTGGSNWGAQEFASLNIGSSIPPDHLNLPSGGLVTKSDRDQLLAPYIRQYLMAKNKLLIGERTVLVLSGKVAQKSYGVEKRFLCPPPSALLLGCSWWTAAEPDPRRAMPNTERLALHPPTASISMSGERSQATDAYSEWMKMSGRVAGEQAGLDDVVIAGRCVGKQLHISEVDERSKKVHALVQINSPAVGGMEPHHIGTFPSKPIKVISKPSKKRQNVKNADLCIHHGTTIALFNRLRSQTVSTKYLCVSGPSASFPAGDWRAMTGLDNKPFAPADDAACFVARTSAWDPFIVYLVDPSKPSSAPDAPPPNPPVAGYPRPPSNALPVVTGGCPTPIYYNQPLVLQCLSTAVVSPIMVIRRVDKASTAIGGSCPEGYTPTGVAGMPVAPGESLGEPVSQLHKIALEVMTDPLGAYSTPGASPLDGFPGSGSFLACLGENVGVHKAPPRQFVAFGAAAAPPTPTSASSISQGFPSGNSDIGSDYGAPDGSEISNDGGKVKPKNRRASTSKVAQRPRKRTDSMNSLGDGRPDMDGSSFMTPRAWTIECGEPAVWTIVGCDVERHSFWIPPVLINGIPPSPMLPPGTVSDVFTTPIPSSPLGSGTATPMPVIHKYLVSEHEHGQSPVITIYGANLRPHLWIWFDDVPSPHVEFKCPEVVLCQVPMNPLGSLHPRQLVMVRDDGVVIPSRLYYGET